MEHRAREYLWTTGNALFSTPRGMSPASYPVLLHLPGRQEPGGRCPVTQHAITTRTRTTPAPGSASSP